MLRFFLDMPPEPSFTERAKNNTWLIMIALAAFVALVAFFIWKQRKNKQDRK
ncbi:MAG TPA: LPXTG cell wall anchor domain-containing protein [Chitinophagaceae bacterium]|nr:LPXTG cell wall anchor domain-containing protein [Chitinophagaceae bacterium]HRF16909.1 LPXTG cell wall anchor domain-containing protein [Chitinophagaceae bacterium]